MIKYFDINHPGYSIKCKLYCESQRDINNCIIFLHGFGGHKDNRAAERFAENVHAKMKKSAVLVFDWPCHGKDVRKKLTIDDCMTYMGMVVAYAQKELQAKTLFAYATSFGGYLTLTYIYKNGNPFKKIALRCPAITMYESMLKRIMTPDNKVLLDKGKDALVGFDRKVKVDMDFIHGLEKCDVREMDFLDYADDILIIQGEKDEIIPPDAVEEFADNNVIECIVIENADHRFQNLDSLKLAHSYMINFFTTGI